MRSSGCGASDEELAFLGELERRGVRFLVVGMSAAILHGVPGSTQDVDLWFESLADERIVEGVCRGAHGPRRPLQSPAREGRARLPDALEAGPRVPDATQVRQAVRGDVHRRRCPSLHAVEDDPVVAPPVVDHRDDGLAILDPSRDGLEGMAPQMTHPDSVVAKGSDEAVSRRASFGRVGCDGAKESSR
jgi:hypothetical protein